MAFIVECMRRGEACDISTFAWDKLLALAERHGWKPAGCVFGTGRGKPEPHWGQPTDYSWDEWSHFKEISAEDACSLAAALRRALAAGITQSAGPTLISDSGFVDPGLATSARKLAEFAERGRFVFAVDD